MKKTTMITTIVLTMCLCFQMYGVMVMNNVTDPLPPGPGKSAVSQDVISGAEHFLKGNAYVLMAFAVYEKEPFDTETFRSYWEKATIEMSTAKKYYSVAYTTVSGIALLSDKQTIAKNFDYDSIADKFLNKAVMVELIEYFKDLNLAGIHKRNLENIDNILTLINSISIQEKADVQIMWTLFSQLNYTAQFGNYATQIAYMVFK